jgi:dolichol-phosphate mannosyltransferase
VPALAQLSITEPGYGMPIELWVQAAHHGLRIVELPVPLIYLDEARSFGGSLDDGGMRLEYYHRVLDSAIAVAENEQAAGTVDELRGDDEFHRPPNSATQKPPKTGCKCP